MKKNIIVGVSILFFIVSFVTLKDYGINWDDSIHYSRGQAFLQYLISGRKTYAKDQSRRSYYQNDSYNGTYFLKNDSAHPPTGDIFSAFFNYIFYQKLNILGDLDSYHLFIIFVSTLTVLSVTLFAYEEIGLVGALVCGLTLATYPIFFSESHFNIKDPVETAFFTITVFSFWKSLQKGNWIWLLTSLVFCAFGLGTKFNIVFLPFILVPYLLIRYREKFRKPGVWIRGIPKCYKFMLIFSPAIVFLIFLVLWPYLWRDPLKNFIDAFGYYKGIGIGGINDPRYFLFKKINLFPIYWVAITTQPFSLFLTLVGTTRILFGKLSKRKTEWLWLLWFLVPISRVMLPNTTIYGGIRQIMEYVPAMALLSGLGAKVIFDWIIKNTSFSKYTIFGILLILFIPQVVVLIRLHPNENVYFNFLVGGLKGASQKKIPYWGNSFGNSYWQAIRWLNINVEPGAKLGLVQGTGSNVALPQLRSDLDFGNMNWTGMNRGGEYLFEMIYGGQNNAYPYVWEYVDKVLIPVYEVKVDGVAIAKIWKNDLAHTNSKYQKLEVKLWDYRLESGEKELNIIFNQSETITRFFLHYIPDNKCTSATAHIETSLDRVKWTTELESIPAIQVSVGNLPKDTSPFFFAARDLKYLRILFPDSDSCFLKSPNIEFWGLK